MSRSPRVLIVITLAEIGGAQSYVARLLPALSKSFDVTVAAWGEGPLVEACRSSRVRFVPLRYLRRPINPLYDLLGLIELVRLMRRLRPEIVHANSSKAGVLARLAAAMLRVPVRLFTVHGWAFKAHHGLAARLYLAADRLMRPLTTMIVCVSERERAVGITRKTCDPERTVVIENAVELAEARKDPENDPPVVLSVGRMKAPKDFGTLITAASLLPHGRFRLRIAGDGPDAPIVAEHADRLGLNGSLELLGDRDDIDALYQEADIFVLSSRSEGMPMSVLEAMAAGVPVVASAVGGIPEVVVADETGLLVDPGDPEALAAALRRLIDDRKLRAGLSRAGRERVREHFDLERWQQAHVELYRSLLSERGTVAAERFTNSPSAKTNGPTGRSRRARHH